MAWGAVTMERLAGGADKVSRFTAEAATAVAALADTGDGTARNRTVQATCLECGAENARATEVCNRSSARCEKALSRQPRRD